jgi:oxalate---CoA ligase
VTSIGQLLDRRAAEGASDAAYIDGASGATLTWGQLAFQADQWAMVAGDLGRDRRIGLVISDPLAMVGAYLSALAAGVTIAPLNPDGTAPERARQAAALGLSAIVTDAPSAEEEWTDGDTWRWASERACLRRVVSHPTRWPAPAAGAAVVLSSSGTTGEPKIIPLNEAQLLHTARAVAAHHELAPSDRGYCPLPMFHINALVVGVLSNVVAGSTLVVERRFSAHSFWGSVERHQATWLNLVPAIIGILADGDAPPPAVRERVAFARSASAPLPAAVRQRFEQRCGIGVLETYGMTEAASQIAANPRAEAGRRAGSVGRPVGVEARVTDGEGHEAASGEIGQVQIRGASVVDHYWRPCDGAGDSPPGDFVPAWRDGWLDTGDLGRIDAEGYLYLVGRTDDVINRGGEKVFPRDIEEVLLRDAEVTAAAVVGRPHPRFGHEPVAIVVARPGADPDDLAARLASLCNRELSRYRRPAAITFADSLPAGPTGKIRHAQLRRELATTDARRTA